MNQVEVALRVIFNLGHKPTDGCKIINHSTEILPGILDHPRHLY